MLPVLDGRHSGTRLGAMAAVMIIVAVAASQLTLAASAPAAAAARDAIQVQLAAGTAAIPGESGSALTRALVLSLKPKGGLVAHAAWRQHPPDAQRPAAPPRHGQALAAPEPPTCTGTGGMLPANSTAILRFLVAHGYTPIAAAGIAGNIYQESQGNPESVGTGGGGLIGWTPLPPDFVTGNPVADLRRQLAALLAFNQQWAQFVPALNAASSPAAAADIYMEYFERPGFPAAADREAAASTVARACGIRGNGRLG